MKLGNSDTLTAKIICLNPLQPNLFWNLIKFSSSKILNKNQIKSFTYIACELRFRATFEDVGDLLPGLLSWMLVGVEITLQWE